MAGNIKGIVIELTGKTSDLTKSLKESDKALKSTDQALKAVNKALKLDPSNIELVAQKEALLTKAVGETEEKLKALREAAELAKEGLEDGTTTNEQYAQLLAEISQLENEMAGLGDEAEETGEAEEEAEEKFSSFGDTVSKSMAVAAVAVAAVTAATVAATKAIVDCSIGGAEFADEFLTLSTITGVSTETLQEWSYAAELIDVDLTTMTGSLTKTTKAIDSFASGNEATIEAFDRLGVSALDANGEMRDSEDVFWDIIDALGEVDNETERDALAMELLGKSAQDLNPLIEAGSEQMEEYAQMAHDAGYVLDDETLGAFGDFDNQLRQLNNGTTAAKNALGTILLPLLTGLAGEGVDLLGEFTNAVLDADGDVSKISEIISVMVPQIIDVVMEYLPMLVELAGSIILAVVDGLIENLPMILDAAVELLMTLVNGILEALPELIPVALDLIMTIVNALVANLQQIVEAAIQIILALIDGLTQTLPQLIPPTIQAIITIAEALIDHLDEIIDAGMDLVDALADGLVDNLPAIVEATLKITGKILEKLLEAGPDFISAALSWGADLVDSFIDGIMNAIPALEQGLSDLGDLIASYLHFTSPDVGPLANDLIGKSGADMVVTFADGMDKEMGTLERALNVTGATIATGITGSTDYSGFLSGIQSSLVDYSNRPLQVVVMVGGEQLDSYVVNATTTNDYRSGGF